MPGIFSRSATGTSSAATAQTITVTAPSDGVVYVSSIDFTVTGAAPGADITATLKDGSISKFVLAIAATDDRGAFRSKSFEPPLRMTERSDTTLVISAGGASATTVGNIAYVVDR